MILQFYNLRELLSILTCAHAWSLSLWRKLPLTPRYRAQMARGELTQMLWYSSHHRIEYRLIVILWFTHCWCQWVSGGWSLGFSEKYFMPSLTLTSIANKCCIFCFEYLKNQHTVTSAFWIDWMDSRFNQVDLLKMWTIPFKVKLWMEQHQPPTHYRAWYSKK